MRRHPIAVWKLLPAVALLWAGVACQTGPKVETVVEQTDTGLLVVQTARLQATVTAIDARERKVTLEPRRGEPRTFRVPESAVNFPQVRVGDVVHATVVEETAVTLIPGGAAPSVGAGTAVSLAPVGAMPGGVVANTIEATATIVAIDGHEHTVTLEFMDGRIQEVHVSKNRDLSQVGLGDSVRVSVTEALALDVVRP